MQRVIPEDAISSATPLTRSQISPFSSYPTYLASPRPSYFPFTVRL